MHLKVISLLMALSCYVAEGKKSETTEYEEVKLVHLPRYRVFVNGSRVPTVDGEEYQRGFTDFFSFEGRGKMAAPVKSTTESSFFFDYFDEKDEDDKDDDYEDEDERERPKKEKNPKLRGVRRKYVRAHKIIFPLLLAYKLKFFTMLPLLVGSLVLLIGTTGIAGFFFALFSAALGLNVKRHH